MPTVLFDLDGTLIDSIELILRSFEHTWSEHGRPACSRSEWLRGVGRPLRSHFADYVEDPDEIEAIIATYRKYNHAHHDDLVSAFPGVHEALAALSSRGIRFGIVTSKARQIAYRGLTECGFDPAIFEVTITSDDDVEPKPHPAPVLAAMDELGATPEQTIFVGDSPHDMEAGRRAGVKTAAALWGPFEDDVLISAGADIMLETPAALSSLHSEGSHGMSR